MATATPVSDEFEWASYPPQFTVLANAAVDSVVSPLLPQWRSLFPSDWSWVQREYNIDGCTSIMYPLLTYGDHVANNSLDYYSFSSFYNYAFETDSTALGIVTTPTSMIVLFLLIMLLRTIKAVLIPYFSSIGRTAGRHTHGLEWEQHNEIRIHKFGEYVFRLLYHFIISAYGIYAFAGKLWWQSSGGTKHLFLGFPFHAIEPGMAWYYLIQSAYNLEALISLLELSFEVQFRSPSLKYPLPFSISWSNTVRGDFSEMLMHHVVTNLLVICSSFFRFCRIGSMVFMVHDISDVPVDLSKLANFLKWKTTTSICFATMVLLWLVFRLTILPFVILKSTIYESHFVLETGEATEDCYVVYQSLFVLLISLIILLHALWFSMFIRMGYILVFKGEAHDLSEHKKGEDQTVVPTSSSGKQKGE